MYGRTEICADKSNAEFLNGIVCQQYIYRQRKRRRVVSVLCRIWVLS